MLRLVWRPTDEQTKPSTKPGVGLVGNRYYDPVSNTYLTRDEWFGGNDFSNEDDGSGVIMAFQVMSMVIRSTGAALRSTWAKVERKELEHNKVEIIEHIVNP